MQSFGSVAALPLTFPTPLHGLNYLTLSEASALTLIRIEEVSEGGSVPNLKVISHADLPVLLLSGEEVKGAKQNRILNTSILIPARSELIIPVSCTERGRWSYDTPDFKESGNISSKDVRRAAFESVTDNLREGHGHLSDQGMVWSKIEELHYKSKSHDSSTTRAMADAFHHRSHDLEEALRHFRLIPGQTGIFIFHSGKAAGLDILSAPAAFARLHDKLVRSYVIDCLDSQAGKWTKDSILAEARRFLDKAGKASVQTFKSPGLGNDLRLKAPKLLGSILECDGQPIHTCLFHDEEAEDTGIVRYYRRKKL
jgi:hypothetical protein